MKTLIKNVRLYPDEESCYENGNILFSDGKIIGLNVESYDSDTKVIDGKGMNLLPGYIDVHVHGGYGLDFLEQPEKCPEVFSFNTVKEGCTAYLASFVCGSQEKLVNAMKCYRKLDFKGARCLGVHMEGPFISPDYKAVMDPKTIRLPDKNELLELIDASDNNIRQMTIAPEMPGALEIIEYGATHGINMMMGHSGATTEEALKGIEKGAFGLTHMYNAMSQHEHRNPGLVTAGMLNEQLICEMICDGFHVHPDVVTATIKKMKDQIALVTDASLMRGLPDGDYIFSSYEVHKNGIKAQVKETGRIAGSVVGMDDVVRNVVKFTSCSLNDIVRMASVNPAKIAGCADHKGRLLPGYDADIILLDDELNVRSTFVEGDYWYNYEVN